MTTLLKEHERIDDLQIKGYRIIQNPDYFCFGMDAVLLSDFSVVKKNEQVLDLGTGTGILPILLEAKSEGKHFTGLEIQVDVANMASRSVELNQLEEKISIVCGDIKEASTIFEANSFNVITCNPPYMKPDIAIVNPKEPKAIARHEVLCEFEDIAREASRLLKPKGRFYMVHRPRRLMDLLTTLRNYHLEPKRIRFVHPYQDKPANMILLEAVYQSGTQMIVEPPLIVYKEVGQYTPEIYKIYGYED
ncbi:tRNA (adenine37-N(6)-)-methyltransferase TrmN6 [Lachnospiraceae bacterium TWA4]|nr:tRNA (adenine37-N(6)-)-methyltransferase TrmN6 [Lachnospiraceae bacterium TWA4]